MTAWLLPFFVLLLVAPSQAAEPRAVSTTATLSILAGTVQHVPVGSTQPKAAVSGMAVAAGDRVVTGLKSTALVTFLDGSTLTVLPESDVTVKKADIGRTSSSVNIAISVGMVWARVVKLIDLKSSLSLDSNTATATVHDGLIGAHHFDDGRFICWTRAGGLLVTDRHGRTVVLLPGEKLQIKGTETLTPETFAPSQSTVTVTTSPGVFPLVEMPDRARVVGFVSPGIDVNQVFGSLTKRLPDGRRQIEVPAGLIGPFLLVLEGRQDGPFSATVTGAFKGTQVYRQEVSGEVRKAGRVSLQVTQQLEPETSDDPKTAKVVGGKVSDAQPCTDPLPGVILLAPTELEGSH
mgnify:CR=1 FL=1